MIDNSKARPPSRGIIIHRVWMTDNSNARPPSRGIIIHRVWMTDNSNALPPSDKLMAAGRSRRGWDSKRLFREPPRSGSFQENDLVFDSLTDLSASPYPCVTAQIWHTSGTHLVPVDYILTVKYPVLIVKVLFPTTVQLYACLSFSERIPSPLQCCLA
jgi:hypothetical protein